MSSKRTFIRRRFVKATVQPMSESADDPEKTPSTTEAEQKEEGMVLAEGWIRIAAVSIAALLLTVLGLLQASGVIDLFPFGEGWTVQWLVFVVIALLLVSVGLWTWRSERL